MTKVMDLKKGQTFRWPPMVRVPVGHLALKTGTLVTFDHRDGMYSFCVVAEGVCKGQIVHPALFQEVQLV